MANPSAKEQEKGFYNEKDFNPAEQSAAEEAESTGLETSSFYSPAMGQVGSNPIVALVGRNKKKLGLAGGLVAVTFTFAVVFLSIVAPSLFLVHLKENFTDAFGTNVEIVSRRRLRNVRRHILFPQTDQFAGYKNYRLFGRMYLWDTEGFSRAMNDRIGIVTENNKIVGYDIKDEVGDTKKRIRLSDFDAQPDPIRSFRTQAALDFGFNPESLNRVEAQSLSEIIDDLFDVKSYPIRSRVAADPFRRAGLFRGNPFNTREIEAEAEAREGRLGRELTTAERVKGKMRDIVRGINGPGDTRARLTGSSEDFDTETEDGASSEQSRQQLNNIPDNVQDAAEPQAQAYDDPSVDPGHGGLGGAVGEATEESVSASRAFARSVGAAGSLAAATADPVVAAADYACRTKALLSASKIAAIAIRTGVLTQFANLVFNTASREQAGTADAFEVSELSRALNTPDELGRTVTESPGYNDVTIDGYDAPGLSEEGKAHFSTTGQLPQPFEAIYAFLFSSAVTAFLSPTACTLATNTLFQVGVTVVTLVVTVFTGGGAGVAKASLGQVVTRFAQSLFTKQALRSLAFEAVFTLTVWFSFPLLVDAAAGTVLNFDEGSFLLGGEALAVGTSITFLLMARNMGLGPVRASTAAQLDSLADNYTTMDLAQMNFVERWLSPSNPRSLVGFAITKLPLNTDSLLIKVKLLATGMLNPVQMFGNIAQQSQPLSHTDPVYADGDGLARDVAGNLVPGASINQIDNIDAAENIRFMIDNRFIKPVSPTDDPVADAINEMETSKSNLASPYKNMDIATYAEYVEVCFESILEEDPSGEGRGYGEDMCYSNGPNAVGSIELDENLEPSDSGEKHTHGLYERFRAYRLDSFLIESTVESINQDYASSSRPDSYAGFYNESETIETFYADIAKYDDIRANVYGDSSLASVSCRAREAISANCTLLKSPLVTAFLHACKTNGLVTCST